MQITQKKILQFRVFFRNILRDFLEVGHVIDSFYLFIVIIKKVVFFNFLILNHR